MPALSQNLEFVSYVGTASVQVVYPNHTSTTQVYVSAPVKGDGYYGSSDGLHTVTYNIATNFVGTVTMQASLAVSPQESDWFTIYNTTSVCGARDDRNFTKVDYYNFTGNFVWVRGQVVIDAGAIEVISYNH